MSETTKRNPDGDQQTQGEIQYQEAIKLMRELGPQPMGLMSSWSYFDDPKRLVFVLARYKFVSKMLYGASNVLEVGCGDAFGSRIVAQSVGHLTAVDFDQSFIESAREIMSEKWPIEFRLHDATSGPIDGDFDGVYALDVLEHIDAREEDVFLCNMVAGLRPTGTLIIGMPSIQSQAYGSAHSRIGHINCKDQSELRSLMQKYFTNVYMFSMNDEVVHTGFSGMAHYNIALCCGRNPDTA